MKADEFKKLPEGAVIFDPKPVFGLDGWPLDISLWRLGPPKEPVGERVLTLCVDDPGAAIPRENQVKNFFGRDRGARLATEDELSKSNLSNHQLLPAVSIIRRNT